MKAEICKELDREYEENKIKVKLGFGREGADEVNGVVRDLRSLYLRVEELLREL